MNSKRYPSTLYNFSKAQAVIRFVLQDTGVRIPERCKLPLLRERFNKYDNLIPRRFRKSLQLLRRFLSFAAALQKLLKILLQAG
jgi:hypothetical protein